VPVGYPRDVVKVIPSNDGVCFDVDYMNRTSEFWNSFIFTLYFSGEKPPEVEVNVVAKGLTLRNYEFRKIDPIDIVCVFGSQWWFWCVLFLYIGGAFLYLRYYRAAVELRRSNAKAILANLISTPVLTDDNREVFLEKTMRQIFSLPKFTAVINALFKKE
jgi:hypothetical protein